jgi:SAM-dependent methyltransferase
MQKIMEATLRIYRWPSQAFWRFFEVDALRRVHCERPILEIGCGDGQFSSLVFEHIDDAIDVNQRSIAKCLSVSPKTYGRIRCLDARELQLADGIFATVYANCVLEHVPSIRDVLEGCFRGLRSGGQLVVTVPLRRMNSHLALPWHWYARLRQRQLCHINLFSESEWTDLLQGLGFSEVQFLPYLSGEACRFWDLLDGPGCIGFGRYRVAPLAVALRKLLPPSARRVLVRWLGSWLSAKARGQTTKEPACAALLVARKSSAGARI